MHHPTSRPRRSYGIPNSVMLMLMGCVYVPIVFGWFVILAAAAVAIGVLALAVVFAALLRASRETSAVWGSSARIRVPGARASPP
jgi:hypothetical protein